MKRKIIFNIFVILLLFLFVFNCTKVKAACSTEEKNKLIQLAYNVKFDYELLPNEGNNDRSFSLTISNLTKDLEVRYSYSTYKYDEKSKTPGIIKMDEYFAGGITHKIKIYSSSSATCKSIFLTTKYVSIPKFNPYFETDDCKKYPDFKLCNMWYEGDITRSEFKEKLETYIKDLNKEEQTQTKIVNGDNTLFETIKRIIRSNLPATIILSSTILIGTVFLVMHRKKRRIKLDL